MANDQVTINTNSNKGEKNPTLRYLAIGCGVLVVVLACACLASTVGGAGFLAYFAQGTENLEIEHSILYSVKRGEEFELELILHNMGSSDIYVEDIDLDEILGGSILDGATTLGTEPEMERDFSIPGVKTFYYNRTIPAGESRTVIFDLEAVETGEFGGSVGIYVGNTSTRIDYVSVTIVEE